MTDWIRDFSSRIKKQCNDDMFPLWEHDETDAGVICVRDLAAFTQMVGKMHFLATHPDVRSDKNDQQVYRIFYRGQRNLHKRLLKPYAYRGGSIDHGEAGRQISNAIKELYKVWPAGKKYKRDVIEAILQQYGGRTTWLDVVDNIWVALWFASMRTFCANDQKTGLEYVEYRVRDPRCEKETKRFAYINVIAVKDGLGSFYRTGNDELLDLRNEIPSFFVRPHAQHGVMVRRHQGDDFADDYRDMIVATIKIPLEMALQWLGTGSAESLSVTTMFPSPYFDTGWRELLFNQAQAGVCVLKQMICA